MRTSSPKLKLRLREAGYRLPFWLGSSSLHGRPAGGGWVHSRVQPAQRALPMQPGTLWTNEELSNILIITVWKARTGTGRMRTKTIIVAPEGIDTTGSSGCESLTGHGRTAITRGLGRRRPLNRDGCRNSATMPASALPTALFFNTTSVMNEVTACNNVVMGTM